MGMLKRLFNRAGPSVTPEKPLPNGVAPPAVPGPPGDIAPIDEQLPTTSSTGEPMNSPEPEEQMPPAQNAEAPVAPSEHADEDVPPAGQPESIAPEPAPEPPDEQEIGQGIADSAPAEAPAPPEDAAEAPEAVDAPLTDAPAADSVAPEAPIEDAAGPAETPADEGAEAAPPAQGDTIILSGPDQVPSVGETIGGRYVVTGILRPEEASALLGGTVPVVDAELYEVEDTRAYERCWSCGSTGNGESQRFCMDCGAPLRQRRLVLARTTEAKGETEEFSENGAFYHLVRPRKQFGSAGMTLEVGACSAEGPHHPNEDSYWTASVGGCFDSKSDMFGVVVLADGMGGYAPGSGLISKMIVNSVGRSVFHLLHTEAETDKEEVEIQTVIRSAVAEANSKVLEEIQTHGEMGATLVVAVVYRQCAYIANIGDSRAYYIAPSGAVTQITRDQSLIEQQVAAGLLSADAAYTAFGNNVILHAIGEERVEEAFDWYLQPLEPGGRLLVCTDGYWKTMRHDVWDAEMAAAEPTLRDLARSMVENALAKGSDDNTTAVLVGID
jgi:serine/threonine protein phosphatase PrpC